MKKIFIIAPIIALTLFSCSSQKIAGGGSTSMSSPNSTASSTSTETATKSAAQQKPAGTQTTIQSNGTTPVKQASFQ